MKKRWLPLLLSACLLLSSCASPADRQEENSASVHILATTYPVYLFTTAVVGDTQGVQVSLLVNSQTSCLHDYTLTVTDMKAIEAADVIVINGAGLEDFMSDALSSSDAAVVDCSQDIELLPIPGSDPEQVDPHIWMDPGRAAKMISTIAQALGELDSDHRDFYAQQAAASKEQLASLPQPTAGKPLITFHDGFQYFAQSYGLPLLKSIEEEEGAEASAAEIREIVSLIGEYQIPAIFTEKNGSDSTAKAIAQETGCGVYQLDMLMSGSGSGLQPYLDAMAANLNVISEALA